MNLLRDVAGRLLDPRARLEGLYRADEEDGPGPEGSAPAGARGRLRPGDVVFNLPLMIGTLIVLAMFFLAVFGPLLAPRNPYIAGEHIVPHYDREEEAFVRPPLPPSAEYPLGTDRWGNDLLSLMMHGARNTLVACAFITMMRLLLGLVLGALAGWNEGSGFDAAIMGIVVVITSVPMLISSTILIYALDIRKGLVVFIIALSIIGWAEIAQYTRSEFLVLRKKPFIEGARATGLSGLQTAVRHVLPNILPQLLVITFLEMGAVMLLLGELGFIGVFIGGGSQVGVMADTFAIDQMRGIGVPDVPEWGAMLAEGFRLLRWRPFVVIPPALAFFVAVLGFNAMGEGLRRLIERSGLSTGFLLRKRMLLVIGAITLATIFIMNNTGPAPWFTKVAEAYDAGSAYSHVETLAGMAGRGAGQDGGAQAAAYLADQFEAYGLEPGWNRTEYVYALKTQLVRPVTQPYLALLDAGGQPALAFEHQLDFGFVIEGHGGSGEVRAGLTFVGFEREPGQYGWETFKGLDLRGRVVLLLQGNAPADFATEALIRGAEGVLWIAGEGRDEIRSQVQLADAAQGYLTRPTLPIYRIRPWVAEAILEQDDLLLSDLLLPTGVTDSGAGWFTRDLDATVQMTLALGEPQAVEIPCVVGYKAGSDFELSGQMVVLFAAYDGLGLDPDGTVYPAANHNASSVGLLLEVARLWHEQDLNARRSVLFVAWGGGQLDNPGAKDYLHTRAHFSFLPTGSYYGGFAPYAIIQPDYVGAGGDALFIDPDSDNRLADLMRETVLEMEIPVTTSGESAQAREELVDSRRTRWLHFAWADAGVAPDEDRMDRIEADKLQTAGKALSLVLTTIVRQSNY
ncbi:MAG: ABC transporter permease subunit [Anaerolineae bacterium]|jgi:peptide/nickel transport system permease protein